MISYFEKLRIEIERETNSFDGGTLLGIYFYRSILSTTLNHAVREIVIAYKAVTSDDTLTHLQYKHSLQAFSVPIENVK